MKVASVRLQRFKRFTDLHLKKPPCNRDTSGSSRS